MSTQSMQGCSSAAIQVALALGDGIIRRQLGRQRPLYAPQVGLEEAKTSRAKPYWYKRLKHIQNGAKKSVVLEILSGGDAGAMGQLSGHPHGRCCTW